MKHLEKCAEILVECGYAEKYGDRKLFIQIAVSISLLSIKHFIEQAEEMISNKSNVVNYFKKSKDINNIKTLYNIKTHQDFIKWEKEIGSRFVKSAKIRNGQKIQSNLHEIF